MPVSCWSDRISQRLTAVWNPDPSQEALAAELRKHPVSQALILVKGSHSIGLERLADLL